MSEVQKAAVAAVIGAAAGYGAMNAMGITVVSIVGGRFVSAEPSPIGIVAGSLAGLAAYGVYGLIKHVKSV